ncbi:DUF3231 family protein [Natronospora cellulosivora (SeqCode)]
MKINSFAEKMALLGKEADQKSTMITIGESYSIWNLLDKKYSAIITTQTLLEQVKDEEFKKIIANGLEVLLDQKKDLEKLSKEFSIIMPERPPEDSNTKINYETINDRFIYRLLIESLSTSMFQELSAYQRSDSAYTREIFKKHLETEIKLYDSFYEYGKLKNYLQVSPPYRL